MNYKLEIPTHWKTVISSEILDIRDGTHDTPKYISENGIPLITSKNLKNDTIDFTKVSYISEEDHFEISKRSKVEAGDILFAMIGTIGNPAIIKGDANFSIKNVGLFKKNEKVILPQFLASFLSSRTFEHQLNERKLLKGTTQKFIPLGNLRKIEIPLPPLSEQQEIVAKIEELLSELDQGKQQLETARQQLKVYRQAVLKWAFEGKLTNGAENWETKRLKEASLKIVVGYVGPVTQHIVEKNGIPFLSTTHIGENQFLNHDIREVSKEFNEKNKKSQVIPGDILIARHGDSGKACMVPDSIEVGQVSNAVILRANPQIILPKFICYRLNAERQRMQKMKVGGVFQVVNTKSMEAFQISIPPLEEQNQIVQEIESRLSVCDKVEETITQSLQQAETLRQSILKQAFEGKLKSL